MRLIGDTERDIEAAKRAKMRSIAALYGYITADENPQTWRADYYVEKPEQIIYWLNAAVAWIESSKIQETYRISWIFDDSIQATGYMLNPGYGYGPNPQSMPPLLHLPFAASPRNVITVLVTVAINFPSSSRVMSQT